MPLSSALPEVVDKTMAVMEIAFWLAASSVFFAYLGYAFLLAIAAKAFGRPPRRQPGFKLSVSFVVAAHNEESRVAKRLDELTSLLKSADVPGDIILVSDGSTDATVELARGFEAEGVRVLALESREGKAAALNAGCDAASHEILVFADMRQSWRHTALEMLLENFADPQVGAVSGDLVLETSPGVMAGVGLYWRYEKWLRKKESAIHSAVGVTGAICAVRRSLFPRIPPGTILDDVYWPLVVVLQGHRVIHDQNAIAYDRLPERAADEFRRKVRTLAGNFQLVARLPQSLLPWRNPLWVQFVSHKLARLVAPWALLTMLGTSAVLALDSELYRLLVGCQIGFYTLALAGNVQAIGSRVRLAGAAASVLVLNAAAWLAFWVWITGRAGKSWSKVNYKPALLEQATP
jgi:cellulose synthase/poly-beta-1,6-N-acetylglucosamine synthase-like glycosyltransferase